MVNLICSLAPNVCMCRYYYGGLEYYVSDSDYCI